VSGDKAFEGLAGHVADFGPHPFLITSMADGRPHVVSVPVRVEDGFLVVSAGRTSRANVAGHVAATLLWPAPQDGDYSLIVDGTGVVAEAVEEITLSPTRAVLHRVAGSGNDLPSCVPVLPPK
jgi:hypothetical protein